MDYVKWNHHHHYHRIRALEYLSNFKQIDHEHSNQSDFVGDFTHYKQMKFLLWNHNETSDIFAVGLGMCFQLKRNQVETRERKCEPNAPKRCYLKHKDEAAAVATAAAAK